MNVYVGIAILLIVGALLGGVLGFCIGKQKGYAEWCSRGCPGCPYNEE